MLILISDSFDSSLEDSLRQLGDVTSDKTRLAEAHIVLVRSKTKCTASYIDQAPHLQLIIRGGVGIDNIDSAYAHSKGILVRNTPTASSIAVAELAFAFMLATPSLVMEANTSMKRGEWKKKELKRRELYGKTLCLIGMGHIATEVAKRAVAFGMRVVAYRKSGKSSPFAEVKATLDEAVREADYLSLHTPATDQTRGLINASLIGKMKKGAVLINTGRADCIVAQDVAAALSSGALSTYCTDVWPTDPPDQNYPLLQAENTIFAPHIGANSQENLLRVGKEAFAIIKNFISR